MFATRIAGSLIPGVLVAFGLFVLMNALITDDNVKLDEDGPVKIADITMPDIEIKPNLDEEKPDKPDEVEPPPPELQAQDIEIDSPDGALNVNAGLGKFQANIGKGGGFARDTDFIPVYVPSPRYPSRAERTGKAGYAVVEVIITTSGSVRDPKLLEEWPENYGFGREALKAAAKLKYNPRVIDGVAVEVPGVLYKFTFAGVTDR